MAIKTNKKKKLKPIVWDVAALVGGVVFGRLIGMLVKNIAALRWLSFEVAFGILDPITIDLVLVKFDFGFGFYLTPAVILFTALFFIGGKLLRKQPAPPASAKTASKVAAAPKPQDEEDADIQYYDA
ncbi:MAG: DUF4321 domain-containing protein [Oscillospiraceae bacterium]|nr:DUF4321 domain-containing protein [Oscillospiraceae bacterium]